MTTADARSEATGVTPPEGATIWNWYKGDAAEHFASLRSHCPVHHQVVPRADDAAESAQRSSVVARPPTEFWSVLTHSDIQKMLNDPGTFTSRAGPGPEWLEPPNEEGVLLWADAPAHTRHRQISNRAFIPRMVVTRLPQIRSAVDDLIDGIAADGRAEVVTTFASALTTSVIADIFGVGQERGEDLYRWGRATMEAFAGDEAAVTAGFVAMQELFAYLQGHIDHRRELLAAGREAPDGAHLKLLRPAH